MSTDRLNKLLQFIKESPNDSFLIFAIAKEYEKQGQREQAQSRYLELYKKDPDYVGLYYHLAKFYEQGDKNIQALKIYEEGIILAKSLGDFHALSELNNAKMNLEILSGN